MTAPTDDNPLLAGEGLPGFDRIRPERFAPAMETVIREGTAALEALEADLSPSWYAIFGPLDAIGRRFERSWGPVGHLMGVMNSDDLRSAYEAVQGDVVNFSLRMRQSEPIYRAVRELRDGPDFESLSDAQKRIIDGRILDAELAGIALSEKDRTRFNEIKTTLSKLGTEFSNHVLDATKAWALVINDPADAEGWPESLKRSAADSYNGHRPEDLPEATFETGPWRITLEASLFSPFMQHCRNRGLREHAYRAFMTRASEGDLDNTALCGEILRQRKQLAQLLGYQSYAGISLAEKMAGDSSDVLTMLGTLRDASWDAAEEDLADLKAFALDHGQTGPIAHWDIGFWAERIRETKYELSDDDLRPYFPHETVLAGLFNLLGDLFGVTIAEATESAPLWHEDVRFFEVHDAASGEKVAAFYYDAFSRPETKRPGAWMDECLNRRWLSGEPGKGELQHPVAHLVCNATPPTADTPSLMSFREVETLFHEFGHGLQHMLTRVDFPDAAGINGVEWDAVELPSQFMENWCYHRPTVAKITGHYKTGQPLPDALFDKLVAARTFRAGSDMLRQLTFGLTDMELHTNFDPDGGESVFDVQRRIMEQTSPLPMFEGNRFLCSFQHIFAGGYAAGYYSYKWAEVLSADAFGAFEDAGLDDPAAVKETGRRFRETVLALGGGRHPMDVFRDFRGREPDPSALLRHNELAG